jgi:uncharacterized protein YkwD
MKDFFKILTGHFLPKHDNAYRPHMLRKPWLLFFLTVVLTSEAIYIGSLSLSTPAEINLSAVLAGEVIALTNVEREQVGDETLNENAALTRAAQAKAEDMAAKGYFSHNGPDGKEPWEWIAEAGYSYRFAGENLAVKFNDSKDVVNAWMGSPTHRANIVKPVYQEIGVGVAQGTYEGSPATFVVQYFGTQPQGIAAANSEEETVPESPANSSVAGAATAETNEPNASTTPVSPTANAELNEVAPIANTEDNFSAREATQALMRTNEATRESALWTIGGVAALLVVLLGLAFFVHLEIQPTEMLAGGAVVAMVALSLYMINTSLMTSVGTQTASVANSQGGGSIGEDGVSFSHD